MKKLLALILVLMLAAIPAMTMLTSCGETDSKSKKDDDEEDEVSDNYEEAVEKYLALFNDGVTQKN